MHLPDPSRPSVEIELDGRTFQLCATYRALALAEDALKKRGHDVNLLFDKLQPTLSGTLAQFAAALHTFHPEIGFDEAQNLVHDGNLVLVLAKLNEAGRLAQPVANPTAPGPAKTKPSAGKKPGRA